MKKSRQIGIINGDVPEITIKGRSDIIFLMYLCESQETFRYMLADIVKLGGVVAETDAESFEISIEEAWQFYEKYINSDNVEQYEINRLVELCNTTHSQALSRIEWEEQEL
jgi:hypothetical protein